MGPVVEVSPPPALAGKATLARWAPSRAAAASSAVLAQGLTLVHFSAQLQRFVWDRGCPQGLCSPC